MGAPSRRVTWQRATTAIPTRQRGFFIAIVFAAWVFKTALLNTRRFPTAEHHAQRRSITSRLGPS
jgi:hypothetical protein